MITWSSKSIHLSSQINYSDTFGGGYRDNADEKELCIFVGSRAEAKVDMKNLIKSGWYKKGDFILTDIHGYDPGIGEYYLHTSVTVKRSNIKNAYSKIPLSIMGKTAKDKDVNMKCNLKLDSESKVPAALAVIKDKIESYVDKQNSNGSSKAEDWLNSREKWVKKNIGVNTILWPKKLDHYIY